MATDFQFLLDCIRSRIHGEELARDVAIEDPAHFPQLVQRHRISPTVFAALTGTDCCHVPDVLLSSLKQMQRETIRRNMKFTVELIRIVKEFRNAKIDLLPLKGPTLAIDLYGGLDQRQFNDLDVLIQPRDLRDSLEVLAQLGYSAGEPEVDRLSAARFSQFIGRFNEIELHRHDGQDLFAVDLHWRYEDDPQMFVVAHHDLFADSGTCTVLGESIATIAPQHLLAFLALHASSHRFMRLSWVVDFALAANRIEDDEWGSVLNAQNSLGRRSIIAGLLIIEGLGLIDPLNSKAFGVEEWRHRLRKITSSALKTVAASEAEPLLGAVAVGMWRWRLTGRIRPLLNALARAGLPKQEDLTRKGAFGPHLSRWKDLMSRARDLTLGRPALPLEAGRRTS